MVMSFTFVCKLRVLPVRSVSVRVVWGHTHMHAQRTRTHTHTHRLRCVRVNRLVRTRE